MSTLIKTIKNRTTDDIIYPITKASAVYLSDNITTVENKINSLDNNIIVSTVNDMLNDMTITAGMTVQTLGYTQVNDGGGAIYQIVNTTPTTYYESLVNGLFAKLISNSNKEINVLQLGIKNDASTDISEIVNANTASYDLYFPAGKYLISNPIYLIKSIRGSGNIRSPYAKDKGKTLFILSDNFEGVSAISIINNDSSLDGVLSLDLRDFSIDMNGNDGNGIFINQGVHRLDSITVIDIRNGAGLYLDYQATRSRALYITNCSFHGAVKGNDKYVDKIGIYLGTHVPDCILSSIEIMNVKIGIVMYNYITMSDIHIYTGHSTVSDSSLDSWWSETVGIVANNGRIHATNLYLDSCHHLIEYGNDANIRIQNLMHWTNDGTASNTVNDGVFFYCTSSDAGYLTKSVIDINGFDYYPRGKFASLFRLDSGGGAGRSPAISIKNAQVILDGYLDSNTIELVPTTYQSGDNYILTMYNNEIDNTRSRIVEVAIADIRGMNDGYLNIYVTETQTGASYVITIERNTTHNIYARLVSRNTKDNVVFYYEVMNTNIYRIYASLPVTNRISVRVESNNQTKTCVNLGCIKGTSRKYYVAKEIDSYDGLTRVPRDGNKIQHMTLSSLGLSSGCSMEDVLSAMEIGTEISLTVDSANDIVDVPTSGELYIAKAYTESAIHRSRLELRSSTQSGTPETFPNSIYIGYFDYNERVCYWYRPTLTLRE